MIKNMEIYRYQAEKLLNTRTELTIYSKRYGIYLKKRLREQFSHEVEISINPQNEQELLLIEKDTGRSKSMYYSRKLVRQIARVMKAEGNMRFWFFKDPVDGMWKGILLPGMTDSYLWELLSRSGMNSGGNLENLEDPDDRIDLRGRRELICFLNRRCQYLIEYRELCALFEIGWSMAAAVDRGCGDGSKNLARGECVTKSGSGDKRQSECRGECETSKKPRQWDLALLYTFSLLRESKRLENRCRRFSPVSMDRPVFRDRSCSLHNLLGWEDPHFSNLEIDEFKGWLTFFERLVLNWLLQERKLGESISLAQSLQQSISEGIASLKEKAIRYYGLDYIRSLLIMV